MQADGDGDGLYDEDESGVYGTNPQVFDTDGDGSGDGEEIYLGTDPLTANAAVARTDSDGDGLYDDDETNIYGTNANTADSDGDGVGDGEEVFAGADPLTPAGNVAPQADVPPPAQEAPAPTCRQLGVPCNADGECCPGALCCWDGVSLRTECTDVSATGVCPGDTPIPAGGCGTGLVDCADGRGCVSLASHAFNCGACGVSCGLNQHCQNGTCVGLTCFAPTVDCGVDHCVDLASDFNHCGACSNTCPEGASCQGGVCRVLGGGGVQGPSCIDDDDPGFGEPPLADPTCEDDKRHEGQFDE
jgi:hypothetical protein